MSIYWVELQNSVNETYFFGKTCCGLKKSSYLCTRLQEMRAFSSAGLEHLPYQRVGGSNPSTPTKTKLGCEKSHPFFLSAQLLIRMKKVKNSEVLLSYIREGRTMTQREKLWLIISLSIPSILAQISATVMFFIDASMVGHLGAKASASIGLVESTGWLMGGLAAAANMGFSVQVAHFIGANDFEAARRVLRQSMVCCMIWAVFISITSLIISPYLPYWLGGTPVRADKEYRWIYLMEEQTAAAGTFKQMEPGLLQGLAPEATEAARAAALKKLEQDAGLVPALKNFFGRGLVLLDF